jgi:hypothetical protein
VKPRFAVPVFTPVRTPRVAALCVLLFAFTAAEALGQNQSSTAGRSMTLKPGPRKVWTEDDLAGLLKPWDLYQIAAEKKSVLGAAVPMAQEVPVSSNPATPAPAVLEIPAGSSDDVLRAMDPRQFNRSLKLLDAVVASWQERLKSIDFNRLRVEYKEREEIERRYDSCQEALESIRVEVTQLSQDQTLKLDLRLLIDLNTLARNLDGLSVNLASPLTAQDMSAAQESIGWAKEVLRIDEELARRITDFQYHALTLAGVWDAALETSQQTAGHAK